MRKLSPKRNKHSGQLAFVKNPVIAISFTQSFLASIHEPPSIIFRGNEAIMRKGLSDTTSAGRCGRYRDIAGNRSLALNTCVIHGTGLHSFGQSGKFIGEPASGAEMKLTVTHESWTGRTIDMISGDRCVTMDFRLTLPGPMYTLHGNTFGFDWAVGSGGDTLIEHPTGRILGAYGLIPSPPQVFTLNNPDTPCLIVTDSPAVSLAITTHEHWLFTFDHPGARVMIVPMFAIDKAVPNAEQTQLLIDLLAHPPVRVTETYRIENDVLTIHADAFDPAGRPVNASPVPPIAALLTHSPGQAGDTLQTLPEFTTLLTGVLGPYAVIPGTSSFDRTIHLDWIRVTMRARRNVSGELSPLPEELTYAGDPSWDERSAMDSLLSHRVYSPLSEIMPDDAWDAIKQRAPIPSAAAFKDSLMRITEPVTGRAWAKDNALFEEWGDVSYDTDWYNGLTLAGLSRAVSCADSAVREPAIALSKAIRGQRAEMVAYYEIFNDWALHAPWSDPRGELIDLDCAHNGLDGLLGEARLREADGDTAGRDACLYLAGRYAVCFLAMYPLADQSVRLKTAINISKIDLEHDRPICGVRGYREKGGAIAVTPDFHSPVTPAPNFPEYCALLKKYGPVDRFKQLANEWKTHRPERYRDWLAYYVGDENADAIRRGTNTVGQRQEKREQAAVFYHVAHDTALRLLILDEDPDAIEAMYGIPMPFSEQLLCRCAATLDGAEFLPEIRRS